MYVYSDGSASNGEIGRKEGGKAEEGGLNV